MTVMHWQSLVDDDAVYILGEINGEHVALKVTSTESIHHEDLANLVAASLNLANSHISGSSAHYVSQVLTATNERRAR